MAYIFVVIVFVADAVVPLLATICSVTWEPILLTESLEISISHVHLSLWFLLPIVIVNQNF